jgi:hypothetical protein
MESETALFDDAVRPNPALNFSLFYDLSGTL